MAARARRCRIADVRDAQKFNAKRRWKSAILTVVASNKFKTMLDMKKLREAKPKKSAPLRASKIRALGGATVGHDTHTHAKKQ